MKKQLIILICILSLSFSNFSMKRAYPFEQYNVEQPEERK